MFEEDKSIIKIVLATVVVILGLIVFVSAIESVDIGERVVVVGYGEIKEVLTEGFHFVNPFYSTYTFDIRNTKYETVANGASEDIQKVAISVVVNYNLNESAVAQVYKTYGTNYIDRIFAQNVQESIKSVSAKYPATELVTKRDEVKNEFKLRKIDLNKSSMRQIKELHKLKVRQRLSKPKHKQSSRKVVLNMCN